MWATYICSEREKPYYSSSANLYAVESSSGAILNPSSNSLVIKGFTWDKMPSFFASRMTPSVPTT